MGEIFDMRGKVAAAEGDKDHMLGKFLYFSLANLLVEKDALAKLCEDLGIPYTGGKRLSVSDAFRSATGDIQERIPITRMGESHIYLAYCRDNKRTSEILSRELVKETLNQRTNQYEKLANISYDKRDGSFRCENLVMDDVVDVRKCCRQAEELFELYQRCANRKQVESICANFLRSIEATKLSINGYLYFVPRTFMPGFHQVSMGGLDPRYDENLVVCTAPSKTFNMAGMQAGNLIIPNAEKRNAVAQRMICNGLFTLSPLGFKACEIVYNECEGWLDGCIAQVWENHRTLKDFVEEQMPGVRAYDMQATYLQWMDCRKIEPDPSKLEERLCKTWVFLDQGTDFGEEGAGFVRMNLACPKQVMLDALERMKKALYQ